MSAPIRRRPGGDSPIKLTPQVEEVRTPLTMVPPISAPMALDPSIAAETSTEAGTAETAPVSAALPQQVATPSADPAAPAVPEIREEKRNVTFGLLPSLKKHAETAVLRTSSFEGGYSSMAALMEGALRRELARLADEFNDGVPFPANTGTFRQGRPFGS